MRFNSVQVNSSISLCNVATVTSSSDHLQMECNQYKSVVSFVDSLVLSAHARGLAPVPSKSLTDFTIRSILGLQIDVTPAPTSSECASDTSPPLSPYSDCAGPRPSQRETSPPLSPYSDCASPRPGHRETSLSLTPYSDITSSSSDCDNEPDQLLTPSKKPTRKRRQRTTFSPKEVWELEVAFKRRPYLISEDAQELVQKLGIPVKSVKYWFQNRRAKCRKLERKMSSISQTNLSNQFGLPVGRVTHSRRLQFVSQSPSEYWKQAQCVSSPLVEENLEDKHYNRPKTPASDHSSVKLNRFRGHHYYYSFPLPMFHPDQFKIRPTEPARLQHSRVSHRFQPY